MSSANQSTLAQAMGMGNSLESMNRVVCRTGTPRASSPGTIQDDGYRQRPQGQALRFTGSRWTTGRRAALGVGGAVAPAADKSLRARQAANTEGPAGISRALFRVSGQLPRKFTEG